MKRGVFRRRLVWGLGLVGAVLLVAVGFLLRGWLAPGPADRADIGPDGEPAEEPARAAQMYTCSMHPQVRSPDPDDKCPICFMDLIPVPTDDEDEEDDAERPRLRVSERAAALMDIRTWPVERRPVEIEIGLLGKIGFDESRLVNVPVRTDAYVERLAANTPWQPVARGDLLAELYSPSAVTAMRELLVAGTDATVAAARARLRRMGVSEQQIAEIEREGVAPRTFRLESPADGVVLAVTAREGEFLREGAHLTRIADLSRVWINLEAYERDLPWTAVGQAAHFTVAGLPGQSFEGIVTFVDPVVDPRSRTARLRVEADNPDGVLRPDMFASARVLSAYPPIAQPGSADTPDAQPHTPPPPLVIPATAPLLMGRRALVYVRVPDTDRPTFEAREVTLGPRAGNVFVVEDGLEEGDPVVVHGQFKIDSELQIRGRPSLMAPEGDAPPAHDHGEPGHDDHAAEPRRQTHCPVMGGPINRDHFVEVEGYRIYVCCPGCDDAILEDPQRYIRAMREEGITPYRLQTHCPVMDLPIDRDHYHDHDGRRIYVCCPGCLDEVRERADEIIEEHRARGVVFEKTDD